MHLLKIIGGLLISCNLALFPCYVEADNQPLPVDNSLLPRESSVSGGSFNNIKPVTSVVNPAPQDNSANTNHTPDITTGNGNVDNRSTTNPGNGESGANNANNSYVPNNSDAISNILLQAISLMGISYRWGGNTPQSGMDCSGFIHYVFKKALGIDLPRTAAGMSAVGKRIPLSNIAPGDLIFFNTERHRRNSHVGMYIGNDQFIQSPHTGETIQISPLNAYWRAHINGVKRIVQEEVNNDGESSVEDLAGIHNEALPNSYIKSGHNLHKHGRHKKSHALTTSKTKRSGLAKVHKTKTTKAHKKHKR